MIHPNTFSPASRNEPRTFAPTNSSVAFWSRGSSRPGSTQDGDSGSQASEALLIYAVDDMPCLTELYALVLETTGHRVKTFTNRHAALEALKLEKPALLITDFLNTSMPVDRFLQECVEAHPDLRILMATGFGYRHTWFSVVIPDRFLQKPFTPDELLREVRAVLAEAPARWAR